MIALLMSGVSCDRLIDQLIDQLGCISVCLCSGVGLLVIQSCDCLGVK